MMTKNTVDPPEAFVIPSRTLRGSRQEMLRDIDQAIVGLLALRHLIGSEGSPFPAHPLRHGRRSLAYRALEWFGLLRSKLQGPRSLRGATDVS